MRILLVNDLSTPVGGAEVLAHSLRDALSARGHDARLLTSDARGGGLAAGADYECRGGRQGLEMLALQTLNPFAAGALRRAVHEFRPDVIHLVMFLTRLSPLVMRAGGDVPIVFSPVWYRAVCPTGLKRLPNGASCEASPGVACLRDGCIPLQDFAPLMLQLALVRRWMPRVGAVVAISERVRQRFEAGGIPVDAVIPAPTDLRPARPPLAGRPTVAFAGRLVPEKGLVTLVRAFARARMQVPEAHLLIAGDGPERDRVRALIHDLDLGLSAELVPHLARTDLECRFGEAWVQAVPSLWDEPFGLAATEAMARGTAVVASASGGLTEIVRHAVTGLHVLPGNEGQLADALTQLLTHRERCETMGSAGREVMLREYESGVIAARYERVYQELTSVTGSATGTSTPTIAAKQSQVIHV